MYREELCSVYYDVWKLSTKSHELKCGKCKKNFLPESVQSEYGLKFYAMFSNVTNKPICNTCYKNGTKYDQKSATCNLCGNFFPSRNKLFKHLKELNYHQSNQ